MFIYNFTLQERKVNFIMLNNKPIYMDNNATTKVDDLVLEAMWPYYNQFYGNASSNLHAYGWEAKAAVESHIEQIAGLIGCEPYELIITSGATESINLAIKGITEAYKSKGNHIVTCKTEHKAVLDVLSVLERIGYEISYLNVDKEGLIDIEELVSVIKSTTIMVCIMSVNNETGVMQDIDSIAQICTQHNVIFFSDVTQHVGKLKLNVKELGIASAAFSAHKFHGPKGVGALYLSNKSPRVSIIEQINGGGHQNNKRSGTLNVPGIVGMAKALKQFDDNYWDVSSHVSKIKNYFEHQLLDIDGLRINGSTKHRIYNTSNIFFPESCDLKLLKQRFAFASGSACSSSNNEPSHVLDAMSISIDEIKRCFRFSFSKYNTLDEVKLFVKILKDSL